MSLAWETTNEDVATVLRVHNVNLRQNKLEEVSTNLDFDAIEQAALAGDEIDEQTNYAYQEIEDQLIEAKVLPENVQRKWKIS
jgi:hypothetical protein